MMFDYEKLHMSSSQKESLKRIREDLISGNFNYEQAFTIIEDYVARYYNPRQRGELYARRSKGINY